MAGHGGTHLTLHTWEVDAIVSQIQGHLGQSYWDFISKTIKLNGLGNRPGSGPLF
jgi:hypothetical protein